MPEDTRDRQVLMLTAWHLPRMRSMPRMMWGVRSLERQTRALPGCLWVHRWISRRSVLLTSSWESAAAADAWLASHAFESFDAAALAAGGWSRIERGLRPPQ